MSRELEPCPFCGGEVRWASGAIECFACNVSMMGWRGYKLTNKRWNQRYKRTCKLIMHDGSPACSECLAEQDYDTRFCDQCGAEVVDGD